MKSVLLADDDHNILSAFTDYLKSEYKVFTACTGFDAINIMNNNPIHAIVCDFNMPQGNGFVVLEHANKIKIPVVMLSGLQEKNIILEIANKHPFYFCDKLESPKLVLSKIREAIVYNDEVSELSNFSKIGKYAAKVVHDLTNPLTIILGSADKIRMNKNDPEVIEDTLNKIENTINKMSKFIRRVKAFSTHGEIVSAEGNYESTSIVSFIADFQKEQAYSFKNNNIKFVLNIPAKKDALVNLDRNEFNRLLSNITDNSIYELNRSSNNTKIIKFTVSYNETMVKIQINDNGPGIIEEIRAKIFLKKITTKPKSEGSGLGLENCLDIINAHNGSIEVGNPFSGAEFIISIPFLKI